MTKVCEVNDYNTIVEDLKNGKVVGFPTETVYGLAIIYDNKEAFDKLYQIKDRSITKPIAMMVPDKEYIKIVANIDKNEKKVIDELMPGPITIVFDAKDDLPYHVTMNQKTIGIRIPDYKIANDILRLVNKPLLVTSANISNKPALIKWEDVLNTFDGKISSLVKEDAASSAPSTVVRIKDGLVIYREGPISADTIKKVLGN